jgi:hypothetical protein
VSQNFDNVTIPAIGGLEVHPCPRTNRYRNTMYQTSGFYAMMLQDVGGWLIHWLI